MYHGWLSFAGNEIINAQRAARYCAQGAPGLNLRDALGALDSDLALALGDEMYESPMVDQAPWFDPNDQDTNEFYGLYPLAITGIDDSTIAASYQQLALGGAVANLSRNLGREILVRCLMIAGSPAGMEAGKRWLNAAMDPGNVAACTSQSLCFFSSEPIVNLDTPGFVSVEDCVSAYRRSMFSVSVITAPKVLSQRVREGAVVREVSFLLLAETPHIFGEPVFTGAIESFVVGYAVDENPCVATAVTPIADPDCPPVPMLALAPVIADECLTLPAEWSRFLMDIPPTVVPLWTEAVANIALTTLSGPVRLLRIRFYPNPFGYPMSDLEECSFCGEFIVSYIPANSTMTLDGTISRAEVSVSGGPQRPASHLLYGSGGAPFTWPTLSCGTGYIMVVDVDSATTPSIRLAVDLIGREA